MSQGKFTLKIQFDPGKGSKIVHIEPKDVPAEVVRSVLLDQVFLLTTNISTGHTLNVLQQYQNNSMVNKALVDQFGEKLKQ